MLSNTVDIDIINNLNKSAQSGLIDLGAYVQSVQKIIWGVNTEEPNIENLKNTISKLSIFGTTENFSVFKNNLKTFLLESYDIELKDNNMHPMVANQSHRYVNGKEYNVKILKDTLSKVELSKLEEMNAIDMDIWENANRIR